MRNSPWSVCVSLVVTVGPFRLGRRPGAVPVRATISPSEDPLLAPPIALRERFPERRRYRGLRLIQADSG